MDTKSLLVVGGTGVISYAVVNEAIKQGFEVTCINRGKSKTQRLDDKVKVIISDYRDEERIKAALKGRFFDAVLDVLCFNENDIEYSLSLFKDYTKHYLFFSSAEAYNKPKYENELYDETAELINPNWSYSINKVKCENKLIERAEQLNLVYTIVRPAITYGNTRIPYGFMPNYGYHGTIIYRMLNHKPMILFNEGHNIATFTRVEDFAIALVGLIGNERAYNQAFHICGDEHKSWKEVLDILADVLSVSPIYINIDSKVIGREVPALYEQIVGGRSYSQKLDNSKIKQAVPIFKTNIFMREGIQKTVDYYMQNNLLNGIDYEFDGTLDRIIKKGNNKVKVGFVDYLGDGKIQDRISYLIGYYNLKLFRKAINFYKRIQRALYFKKQR